MPVADLESVLALQKSEIQAGMLSKAIQAFTYFQSKGGFVEGSPNDLPPARREKYHQSGRNSQVLVKKLK